MQVTKGIRLRLYPNQHQKEQLRQLFGNDRKVWNLMLAMANTRYQNNPASHFVDRYAMDALLPRLKEEMPYLKESDSTSFQIVDRQLSYAFKRLFKHQGGHPRFHSRKSTKQSYTGKSKLKILAKRYIKIPKLGCIKSSKTGRLQNVKVKEYTVCLMPSGHYVLSVIVQCEIQALPKTGKVVGLDLGSADLIIPSDATSDKDKFKKFTAKALESKAKLWQSRFSRRKYQATVSVRQFNHNHPELPQMELNDYSNWQRARQHKARLQEAIKNKRAGYLQRITTELVRKYDVIAIENLRAKNIMRNHNLAGSIANASWRKVRDLLSYKCTWYGKQLVVVSPRNTSRICHSCGRLQEQFKGLNEHEWLAKRNWRCEVCGAKQDRDINAAKNILSRGLEKLNH